MDTAGQSLIITVIHAFYFLDHAQQPPYPNGPGTIRSDIKQLITLMYSGDVDLASLAALFKEALQDAPDWKLWSIIKDIIT